MLKFSSCRFLSDYSRFLSPESARRQPSAIRALMPLLTVPGMISLGGGLPNSGTFPLDSALLQLKDGTKVEVSEKEMKAALQYSATDGLPSLVDWINTEMKRSHKPPVSDWRVCVTNGSQDALTKAFAMLLQPGDVLLCEEPTYSGALAYLQPSGAVLNPVGTDHLGIIPEKLEEVLRQWDTSKPRPKALYCIPNGQNPSGATLDVERRRRIYALACEFDFLILEDDPYYYLQFPYDAKLQESLFSMDKEGRVIRFDSFSKVLSAGMRLGWASGPSPLIERICLHTQATGLHASGLSQQVAASVLQAWGPQGWSTHVRGVRQLYEERRNFFLRVADEHLTGLAEWSTPAAGMFVWFKLKGIDDATSLIHHKARDAKVLLVPGSSFLPLSGPSPYVRAAFSTATEEEMEVAIKRLAGLLKTLN